MKKLLLFLCIFTIVYHLHSQDKKNSFPEAYLGIYKGTLTYETKNGLASIPMEFHLQKTDSIDRFDYWLVYNNQPRKYSLLTIHKEKGLFSIDENNGIVLPVRFYQNVLYSWFEVGSNKLTSRLQFETDTIYFEILFSNLKNKITTGGISEEIPQVFGYPISAVQKAILIKEN